MKVVVLMGGSSSEREVSFATGMGVAGALEAGGHEVVALDPHEGKVLDVHAPPAIGEQPTELKPTMTNALSLAGQSELLSGDVIFVALHGGAGEDGTLQALLDLSGVPYTGSGMLASALAMDKTRAKAVMRDAGVPCPQGILLTGDTVVPVQELGGYPLVVKPNREGSSVGVHLVSEREGLEPAIKDAGRYGEVLVEQFIPGRELTVAVLDGEALPVVEIIPQHGFYDYRHKYTQGETNYRVPAELDEGVAQHLTELGVRAFQALDCAGVARVDFRLNPQNEPFCLEVNTVPGMTATSLVPMAAQAKGISYGELVSRLIQKAVAAC